LKKKQITHIAQKNQKTLIKPKKTGFLPTLLPCLATLSSKVNGQSRKSAMLTKKKLTAFSE